MAYFSKQFPKIPANNTQQWWDQQAQEDPFWIILTDPTKRNNKWDKGEFFLTGRNEINQLIFDLRSRNVSLRYKRALDFGCGVGRLTQALAKYFRTVDGIDISSVMTKLANKYNQYPQRVHYVTNASPDLNVYPEDTFDFIYSSLVLQHIVPPISTYYLKDFFRILKPKGVVVFQIPERRIKRRYRSFLKRILLVKYFYKLLSRPIIPMYCLSQESISKVIKNNGGEILYIIKEVAKEDDYVHCIYIAKKV